MGLYYKKITITEGGAGADDKRVKVSTDDAQSGFLEDKIVAGSTKVDIVTLLPGSVEQLQIDVDETQIDHNNLTNYDIDEHRLLDDGSTTSSSLWSSQKIQDELDTKINAALPMTDNKLVKSVGTSGVDVEATTITVDDSNNVTGINDLTISGDLTVNGTTTSVNSTNLEIVDGNIIVNKGGTQASANSQDAGITVEMSDATDAAIGYDSTMTSKFKVGEVGSEEEILTVAHSQVVQNKSIDLDDNTLSNIETDNFKTGVVQTDISGAVSNTNLASSQAIKTYITDQIATKDEASEINYDNSTSGLAATDAQAAIDEVEGRLDTAETTLSSHLNTDPSKHNANQINFVNTTSGLVATQVQAAIDELDGIVDGKLDSADFDTSFDNRLALKDTDDLTEGVTNLYFTDERAQDAVGNILTDSSSIDFTYNDGANTITAAVLPAGVDHDSLSNFVANEHIDHSSVDVETVADSGLTGGGDLTSTRSLSVDISGTTLESANDNADSILIYDDSASALRQQTRANFLAGISQSSTGDIFETSFAASNNVAVAANVTGLAFANGSVRSFDAVISININATAPLLETVRLLGIQKGSSWDMSIESVGDDSGLSFSITNAGQVQYTSTNEAGFVSNTIKFRAITTSI